MKQPNKAKKILRNVVGTTLIEVCTCLAIMGISTAASLTTVKTLQDFKYNSKVKASSVRIVRKLKSEFLALNTSSMPAGTFTYYFDSEGKDTLAPGYYQVDVTPTDVIGIDGLKSYNFIISWNEPRASGNMKFEVLR